MKKHKPGKPKNGGERFPFWALPKTEKSFLFLAASQKEKAS